MKHFTLLGCACWWICSYGGDGLEEPPVEPGMNVKIKLNEENEITHIILDDHHKFQQIEAIEVKNVILKTTYS